MKINGEAGGSAPRFPWHGSAESSPGNRSPAGLGFSETRGAYASIRSSRAVPARCGTADSGTRPGGSRVNPFPEKNAEVFARGLISRLAAGLFSFLIAVALLGAGEANAQLTAAFGLNEGTVTSTVNLAGGANGTLTSTTWSTAGQVGNALSFNGSTSRVNVADSGVLDFTTGVTLEAWVFPTSLTGTRTVIAKERSGGFAYALFASNGASRPAAPIRVGSTAISVAGPGSLPLNAWSHPAANAVYVASYHTTAGRYPYDSGYFSSTGADNGVLHAPSSDSVQGNDVYLYGAGGFPINTFNGTNYWVDIAFRP